MDALADPISKSLRPVRSLGIEASCANAASALRHAGGALLPLLRGDVYAGSITESGLRRALEAGAKLEDPIETFLEEPLRLPPYATGADALRRFEETGSTGAVIVDDGGIVWGVLYPSDLFPKPPFRIRPSSVGGMAAPYGVFLTAGVVSAGPNQFALFATGANLMVLLLIGRILAFGTKTWLAHQHAPQMLVDGADMWLQLPIFALLMRFSPLAGYHAAEHQVVHTIERSESLTLETVARMPRVHPRCGTNLATGLMLASFIAFTDFGLPHDVALIQLPIGLAFGLAFWRRLGSLVQYWITTRKPTKKQLEAGIRSGERLLEAYAASKNLRPNPWRSLWNAGMVQVALGAFGTGALFAVFFDAIHRLDILTSFLGSN